jgi:hypothetical protein
MRSFYGPLLLSLGLVERRVVKGERKVPLSGWIKVGLDWLVVSDLMILR